MFFIIFFVYSFFLNVFGVYFFCICLGKEVFQFVGEGGFCICYIKCDVEFIICDVVVQSWDCDVWAEFVDDVKGYNYIYCCKQYC